MERRFNYQTKITPMYDFTRNPFQIIPKAVEILASPSCMCYIEINRGFIQINQNHVTHSATFKFRF